MRYYFIPSKLAKRNLKIGQFLMLGGNGAIETLIHFLPACMFTHVQLCDPMDCSPPGSSVHGIFQGRILKWLPPPGNLPDPGIKPASPPLAGGSFTPSRLGSPIHSLRACMHAQLLHSCLTVCDPMDCSPLGSSVG